MYFTPKACREATYSHTCTNQLAKMPPKVPYPLNRFSKEECYTSLKIASKTLYAWICNQHLTNFVAYY